MGVFLVGREGVELSQCLHRRILSPLRLPIPPSPQTYNLFYPNRERRQGIRTESRKTRVENCEIRQTLYFLLLTTLYSPLSALILLTTFANIEKPCTHAGEIFPTTLPSRITRRKVSESLNSSKSKEIRPTS